MKSVFEIELAGEKKSFSLGKETWDMFYERSGIAGQPESEENITKWLCTDIKEGLTALCEACGKMLELLNINEN